jgi:Trk-type K+ transport system membrane component
LASGTSPSPAAALYSLARYFRAYSIGRNMTDAQWSAYNTAMQAFQTALTRNV